VRGSPGSPAVCELERGYASIVSMYFSEREKWRVEGKVKGGKGCWCTRCLSERDTLQDRGPVVNVCQECWEKNASNVV